MPLPADVTLAGEDKDKKSLFPEFKFPASMNELTFDAMLPIGTTISFGVMSGFASGYAAKKGARAATGVLGGLFFLFQGAHHLGYVTVNMDKIEKDVMSLMDSNGDGKFDQDDAQEWLKKTVTLLTCDTKISAGTFTVGFVAGLRQG